MNNVLIRERQNISIGELSREQAVQTACHIACPVAICSVRLADYSHSDLVGGDLRLDLTYMGRS